MAYTEIYTINKNGDVVIHSEIQQSLMGAMFIWRTLEEKYLPSLEIPNNFFISDDIKYFSRFSYSNENKRGEVWGLCDSESLTNSERLVLFTTFDNIVFKKEDIYLFIGAFEDFTKEYDNHNLKEQLKVLKAIKNDSECLGFAYNQTSVNCDVWDVYEEIEDDIDEYNRRPVNINIDLNSFYYFENFIK